MTQDDIKADQYLGSVEYIEMRMKLHPLFNLMGCVVIS